MDSKLVLSTLYRREYIYTVDKTDITLSPFQVVFKALSLRDIDFIRNFTSNSSHTVNILILQKAIVRFCNVMTNGGVQLEAPNIDLLSYTQVTELAEVIVKASMLTKTIVDSMQLNVTLSMDEKFSTDTWGCELCRHKGLDKLRNCKFRDDYQQEFRDGIIIMVGDEQYDHCPMYYKDDKLVSDIFSCYGAYDKGLLPDTGGTVDQTEFFSHAVNIVQAAINKRDAPKDE